MHYKPIENYGVIGDLHTVALVGMDGSIDFMCFPRFDSPTIFAALVDPRRGGRFQLAPVLKPARPKQLYMPDSNILLTRFLSEAGVGEVSDFMPITDLGHAHNLVRRAKTIRGDITWRMVCGPRFDYARAGHRVEKKKNEVLFHSQGPDKTVLRLRSRGAGAHGGWRGGWAEFCSPLRRERPPLCWRTLRRPGLIVLRGARLRRRFLQADDEFLAGVDWENRNIYGRWRNMVNRSALTLKLLTSAQYGSIVAAPTFGLPEEVRGSAELGLPLHLDSGRVVHIVRADAAGVHRRGGCLRALA